MFPPQSIALFRTQAAIEQGRGDITKQIWVLGVDGLLAPILCADALKRASIGFQDTFADCARAFKIRRLFG
jgi:hypothetical protein